MILNEGIKVRFGADNTQLLSALRTNKAAVAGFATAAVAALGTITAASLKMSAQLDHDLRLVSTLGGEAAGNIGQLRAEVKALGTEFGRDFRQLASANYQAVSGGFKSIAESVALTRAGTKLAVAGNADLVGSTEAVVKALNAFDMSADDAEKAAAQLWGITRDGIITVEQLGRFMADLPVAAAASGLKFEEMSAAISTLTAAGVPASTAMDQIRSAIIQLEKQGITGTFVERIERFAGQGLGEIVNQVGDQTAARGILVLARSLGTFRDNIEAARNVTDDYNDAVDTMQGSTLTQWQRLQQNINSLMDDLGSALVDVVNPALATMNALLNDAPADKILSLTSQTGRFVSGPGASRLARGDGLDRLFGAPNPLADVGYRVPFRPGIDPLVDVAGGFGPDPRISGAAYGSTLGLPPFQNPQIRGLYAPPQSDPTKDFIAGELEDFDFDEWQREFVEVGETSRIAAASAGILSSTIGGALTAAFVTAESGAGRFVQGLLAQFAQLGVRTLITSAFGLPGFSSGGFTGFGHPGSVAGVVHGGEYVMPQHVVQSLGLGRMERLHAAGAAGNTSNTINVTVNAGSGDAAQIANLTADTVVGKMREAQYTGRDRLYQTSAQRYGGR